MTEQDVTARGLRPRRTVWALGGLLLAATSAALLGPPGAARATTAVPGVTTPTSVSAVLAGGGKTGKAIAVVIGTPVTAAGTLSGQDVATATGTVTYDVYADEDCTRLVATGGVVSVVDGVVPESAAVTLTGRGSYYWETLYSGDTTHAASSSGCGAAGNVETMWSAPPERKVTSLSASLSSGGRTGKTLYVLPGSPVTDTATLSGDNASNAQGTVTYRVYSDAKCTRLAASAGTASVGGGVVPSSAAVSLKSPGTYRWTVSYSGDPANDPTTSRCGMQTVTVGVPSVDARASAVGQAAATVHVSTAATGELLVAYVAGKGPAGKTQKAVVSAAGLKWKLLARSNAGRGDAEIWYVRSAARLSGLAVTATERYAGWKAGITVVAYKYASGPGPYAVAHAGKGAPSGSVTTNRADSRVFAVGDDWARAAARTPGAGQRLVFQSARSGNTLWVQSEKAVTPAAGTSVTINDAKPAADPYDLVLVAIN